MKLCGEVCALEQFSQRDVTVIRECINGRWTPVHLNALRSIMERLERLPHIAAQRSMEDRERANAAQAAGPMLPVNALCGGCGTSVDQPGDLCHVCAAKQAKYTGGPKAAIELHPQPEPIYHREGSYRKPDPEPADPSAFPIVTQPSDVVDA